MNSQLQHFQWPIQAMPNKATWQLWTNTLQLLVCNTTSSLAVPLRKWTHTYEHWTTYYDIFNNTICHCNGMWRKQKSSTGIEEQ
eukprot:9742140-Ditylum_brightwellii.AAC.1